MIKTWMGGRNGTGLEEKGWVAGRREKKRKRRSVRKKKKVLDFKSSGPNSGMPDDLGHVTLPSVPSVWPVNIPLTPVKT